MLGPEQCTISNISAITIGRVGYIKIRFKKEALVQQLENTSCFMNFWPLLIFKKGYKFNGYTRRELKEANLGVPQGCLTYKTRHTLK